MGVALLLVASCPIVVAQADHAEDEAAIRQAVQFYVASFNKGDAAAVAGHWSENGEWINPTGARIKGRKAIATEMAAYFAESRGQHIEVTDMTIRFLAPTVAVEEGTVRVTRAGAPPSDSTYIAVHVKQGGEWKMDSVRETAASRPRQSAYDKLEPLEWMVGTWVDRDEQGGSVETTCGWTKNKNFLLRSFSVRIEDRIDLQGTQVVGWDAANKRIRSWVFDSAGGFAAGVWTRDGDRWQVKSSQTLADGTKASSINIITPIDDDSFMWQSIGRETAGELQPNLGPVTIVRIQTEIESETNHDQ